MNLQSGERFNTLTLNALTEARLEAAQGFAASTPQEHIYEEDEHGSSIHILPADQR